MMQKKVCLVGPVCVGKTSLVARYVHSAFSEKYLSTMGVKVDKKSLTVDATPVTLMLWDLAGDDDFQRLQTSYLRGSAGYLLVADGSRRKTLEQAVEIQGRVVQALGPVPFILALNKADLADQWEVPDIAVAELAARGWRVRRTSAKNGSGVEDMFAELARLLLSPNPSER